MLEQSPHMGIDELLESRRKLQRLAPRDALKAVAVLEWRLDPSSPWRDPELARANAVIILMCDEGYQSSLAAGVLKTLGLSRATDLVGGFQAWSAAGLPVDVR
jgi:rhodanese-related sulfurtransferase